MIIVKLKLIVLLMKLKLAKYLIKVNKREKNSDYKMELYYYCKQYESQYMKYLIKSTLINLDLDEILDLIDYRTYILKWDIKHKEISHIYTSIIQSYDQLMEKMIVDF